MVVKMVVMLDDLMVENLVEMMVGLMAERMVKN
jgi:hypothetical protein